MGKIEQEKKASNEIFLQTKYLFLTYPKAPSHWTISYVKNRLINEILVYEKGPERFNTKVRAWCISRETHKEKRGSGDYERGEHHFHGIFELKSRSKILTSNTLDIEIGGDGEDKYEMIHGNYQSAKNPKSVLNYVKKDGNYEGEGFPGLTTKHTSRDVLEASDDLTAKMMASDRMRPKELLDLRSEIEVTKQVGDEKVRIMHSLPSYQFQEVVKPFLKEMGFNPNNLFDRSRALLAFGEPESGKTSLGQHIENETGWRQFKVIDYKDFKQYDNEEIIILDEMTAEKWKEKPDFVKSLITNMECITPPYYGNKKLAPVRKVIITTNEDAREWDFPSGLAERLILVKTKKNGEYQYMVRKQNEWVMINELNKETLD